MSDKTKRQHYTAQAQTKQWQIWTANGANTGSLMTFSYEKLLEPKNPDNLLQRRLVWSQETEDLLARHLDTYVGKVRDIIAVFDQAQPRTGESAPAKMSQVGLTEDVQLAMFNYAYLLRARYEAAMKQTPEKVNFLEGQVQRIQENNDCIFRRVADVLSASFWAPKLDFPVPDSGFFHFLIEQGNQSSMAVGVPITEDRVYVIRFHGQYVAANNRPEVMGRFSAGTICNRKLIISPKLAAENASELQQEALAFEFAKHRRYATWRLWSFTKLAASGGQIERNAEVDYILNPQIPSDDEMLDLFLTTEFHASWIWLVQQHGFPRDRFVRAWTKRHRHDPFS